MAKAKKDVKKTEEKEVKKTEEKKVKTEAPKAAGSPGRGQRVVRRAAYKAPY